MIVTDKEMEALLFVMDDAGLIGKLLERRGICWANTEKATERLRPLLVGRMLPSKLSKIERLVVQVCIEDSDWPLAYAEHRPEELDQSLSVLRGLARKVERLGIEVDRIAHAA